MTDDDERANMYEQVQAAAERLSQQARQENRFIYMGRQSGKSQMAYWYNLWRQQTGKDKKDHFVDNDDLFNI